MLTVKASGIVPATSGHDQKEEQVDIVRYSKNLKALNRVEHFEIFKIYNQLPVISTHSYLVLFTLTHSSSRASVVLLIKIIFTLTFSIQYYTWSLL